MADLPVRIGHVQFFSAEGNGPDVVPLSVRSNPALVIDGKEIAPPKFVVSTGADDWGVMVSNPGAYFLGYEEAVRLRNAVAAWVSLHTCPDCGGSDIERVDGGHGNVLEVPCSTCSHDASETMAVALMAGRVRP